MCGLGGWFDRAMDVRVVAVDIGSVKPPSRFGWAAFDAPSQEAIADGNDPDTAVSCLLDGLAEGRQAALLVEAPMSVPVPAVREDRWRLLGRARDGEGNRSWSAGAGMGALATGLAQGAWMLKWVAEAAPAGAVTTQPALWRGGRARLLLAEVFVSGAGKPVPVAAGQHAADATAAGKAVIERLDMPDGLVSDVRCSPHEAFNLLAAMAMWAGLAIDPGELREDPLVIRVQPVPL
jgi:hypothetical protein